MFPWNLTVWCSFVDALTAAILFLWYCILKVCYEPHMGWTVCMWQSGLTTDLLILNKQSMHPIQCFLFLFWYYFVQDLFWGWQWQKHLLSCSPLWSWFLVTSTLVVSGSSGLAFSDLKKLSVPQGLGFRTWLTSVSMSLAGPAIEDCH